MATEQGDYYDILGVTRDADEKTIKDAFRTLALQYHPDRNKAPDAEERFKEIAAAYAVLSDPKKRAEYDAGGFAGVEGFSAEDLFGHINFEDIFGGFGLGGFDLGGNGGGIFDRLFRRHRRPAGPSRGADLEAVLDIPLERVVSGGEETLRIVRPQACMQCQGSGAKAGTAPRDCETCQGSGRQTTSRRDGGIMFQQITTCPTCHGRGTIIDEPCPDCHGQGQVEREDNLAITVPVGAEDGMRLRVPGHGMPSPEARGRAGDLYVLIRSKPDPRFQRRGSDLWRTETVSVVDAVLGRDVDVPTLDASTTVTIPPGTQPDTVLRLHDKGLPVFGAHDRGDLYLRLRVHIPEHLSSDERELYERLQALREKKT